jgi:hypothetical protein
MARLVFATRGAEPNPRSCEVVMSKPLRCRLGWHKWVTRYASDGTTRFLQCRRCPMQAEFEPCQWWTGG